MDTLSYLSNAEIGSVEALYEQYKQQPDSVDEQWRRFFEGFDLATLRFAQNGKGAAKSATAATPDLGHVRKEIAVLNLIQSYRTRGHLWAKINPILPRTQYTPTLAIENFGLSEADLDLPFQAGAEIGIGTAPLRQIIQNLEQIYCGSVGVEYMYIRIPQVIEWFRQRLEPSLFKPNFSREDKLHILRLLGKASSFESFLHRKFVGQKRFSLEGAESIIPALEGVLEYGAELGVQEFVIGMAHRGRLNVLTNIMRKEYDQVFGEFEGKGLADNVFDGDVKYHMGFSSDPVLRNGKSVHLSLSPNPSHLETVDPVVVGMARAKMMNQYGKDHDKVCPILIHGDAAVAGQGVVYELLQMSRLEGYEVGGSIHIVLNNQIGFTTDQKDARSSTYCTDVGKVTLSPVFHVNGDDPEALTHVTKLAMEFRQEFNRDVFIDILCYRRYGHNEGDEPRFTQPRMYDAIASHPIPFRVYSQRLIDEGTITEAELKKIEKEQDDYLNKEYQESKEHAADASLDTTLHRNWSGKSFYDDNVLEANPRTSVPDKVLKEIARKITTLPADFNAHKNITKLVQTRADMLDKDSIDWGMAEHLAFGSLLAEGMPVRLSGQDVERGTFSHRHAYLKDQLNYDRAFVPLNNIKEGQAQLMVHNSNLSEYGVMGFEFGYASAAPNTLTIWEAQFGDFANGAQIIIDQFLASSKTKWLRMNGLVLLLPHGYEGQGPEHSSARLERFLQLCAQHNMYVCNFTNPANFFHALRRQVMTPYRRPLVVMTPKSLLRHPKAVSTLKEFTKGGFIEVMDDAKADAKKIKRVVLCTGKVYYDLLEQQEGFGLDHVAIVRMEQIYPIHWEALEDIKKKYSAAKEWIWCQEEPENMGAWPFVFRKLHKLLPLEVVARKEASSPATGSSKQHAMQQQYIVRKALDLAPDAQLKKVW